MGLAADPRDVAFLRRLGEGTFAIVDLCEYSGQEELPLISPRVSSQPSNMSQTDRPTQMTMLSNASVLVAVKKMKTHISPDVDAHGNQGSLREVPEKWVENFKSEAALLRSLKHPNVVGCYGTVAVPEPDLHLLLEYCAGGNLRQRIERNDYDAMVGLQWLLDIARGMAYLHDKARGARMAHRDLKPENIMLTAENTAKIGDFGLCKAELHPGKPAAGSTHSLPPGSAAKPSVRKSFSRATVAPTKAINVPQPADTRASTERGSTKGTGKAADVPQPAGGKGKAAANAQPEGSKRPPTPGGTPRLFGRLSRSKAEGSQSRPSRNSALRLSTGGGSLYDGAGSRGKRTSLPALVQSGAWELKFKLNLVGPQYVEMTGQTGSSLFMAPENYLRKPYTDKVDIFSFSIIMVEVLARRRAYEGLFLMPDQIAHAVAHKNFRPKVPSNWPEVLLRLVRACWDEDPAKRPSSKEIVRQLEHFISSAKLDPKLLSPLERKTKWSVFRKK